jgi:hypothetical protein
MSIKRNKQNLISYINLKDKNISIMLNYGTSLKSSIIEDYNLKGKKIQDNIFVVLKNVLESFVLENYCKQPDCYVVIPDSFVSTEYITIPNNSGINVKNYVKSELSRLVGNLSEYNYESNIVLKQKKNVLYKIVLVKKEYLDKIHNVYKSLGLNLKGVTFDSNAEFCAYASQVKLKNNPSVICAVKENGSKLFYFNKEKLIAYYNFDLNLNDIEKSNIKTGSIQNSKDALYEVYFSSEIAKKNFLGIQLDINGEPLEKKSILDKENKKWKIVQQVGCDECQEMFPIIKLISSVSNALVKEGFLKPTNILFNFDYSQKEKFVQYIATRKDCEFKSFNAELKNVEQIMDYINLYGAIFCEAIASENVFMSNRKRITKRV